MFIPNILDSTSTGINTIKSQTRCAESKIQSLLPEININQNRLQPLSDCVDKVLDNNNYEYSETESIPDKLCFERTVYSSLLDKIGLLNNEIIAKMILYYSETKDVEEEYKNLEIIHGASHGFLNYLIT